MTQLSVNINKIATIRNARGGNIPDVLLAAQRCEQFGAQGITVHPRPDERHIRYSDVYDLKKQVATEFNIEGYPSESFLQLVLEVQPEQVTLVPDAPDVLTSNAGWSLPKHNQFLRPIVQQLKEAGIRVSLFVDPQKEIIKAAAEVGADRVELYTEPYARAFEKGTHTSIIKDFVQAAQFAHSLGLGVNAGHDLNLENLAFFSSKVQPLDEVSIGHALISDALYMGLEETIKQYRQQLQH